MKPSATISAGNLLPTPDPEGGAFRHYPLDLIDRIRFIKRAQELGFSLDEIATLLALDDGTDRKAIRKTVGNRLQEIRNKIADLQRMENVLAHLMHECETTGRAKSCPIIAALAGKQEKAVCRA